jgi:membrane fusion protein (multidrug efflux system)
MSDNDRGAAKQDEADALRRHGTEFRRDNKTGVDEESGHARGGRSVPEAWGRRGEPKGERHDEEDDEKEGQGWSRTKKVVVGAIIGAVLLLAAIGGLAWWLYARQFEKTDDAFIDAHSEQVSPQVAGRVRRVLVNDNQEVRAGDVLVEIDPADYRVQIEQGQAAVAEAEGRVSQAQAQKQVDEANVEQARADLNQAQVNEQNARTQLARYEGLSKEAVSPQRLDDLRAAARNAEAQRVAMEKKLAAAQAQVRLATSQIEAAQAGVKAAQGRLDQAQLNLGYTTVRSAIAGRVTNRNVQAGDYVTAGQQLMVLVPQDVWVTANYKETQLAHMKPGQEAEIKVDAFPDVEFRGHVDSIQKGAGAWFSLLPPENATGNYVKVVQRVPVKIVFDETDREAYRRLAPGMSVVPKVRVR